MADFIDKDLSRDEHDWEVIFEERERSIDALMDTCNVSREKALQMLDLTENDVRRSIWTTGIPEDEVRKMAKQLQERIMGGK